MEISTNPEYVSVVRLATSGIANKIGFSIDEIEDLMVAVSEACTNVIKHTQVENFIVIFDVLENGLNISIVDNGKGCNMEELEEVDLKHPKEGGLGLFIIKSLMDEVKIESDENIGTFIKMTKYLGVDI
jgi:serine/threonine-protein kinase RsbW